MTEHLMQRIFVCCSAVLLTCGAPSDTTSSQGSGVTEGGGGGVPEDDSVSPDEIITDPVPPPGFVGDPYATEVMSAEEQAAMATALTLSSARNPPGQDPSERGFAIPPNAHSGSAVGVEP